MALTIHQAGIDAAINAQANGFAGVTLNRVDLYNGNTQVASLTLEGVQVIEPARIYVVAQDSSTATYDVQRIDFYTSTGVKFATAQNDDGSVIQSKAANTTLLLAHQLNIASAPGSVAPSGDVSVYAPQATESLLGTAEIATQGETDAGSDDARFVTPKKLWQWLRNKLSSSVTSTSTTTPASVKGVKTAYDRGSSALSAANSHAGKTDNPHGVTKSQVGLGSVPNYPAVNSVSDSSSSKFAVAAAVKTAYDKAVSVLSSLNSHTGNKSNPHGVTKSQVGLGSVNNWGATSSTSDSSSSKYATAAGVKSAYDAGVRQATESLRGQMEIANDAETKGGADKTRAIVPYYLKRWWDSVRIWENIKDKPVFKTAALRDAGQNDGEVALIGDPSSSGRVAVVVSSGSNANGWYRVFSDGLCVQGGEIQIQHTKSLPINLSTVLSYTGVSTTGSSITSAFPVSITVGNGSIKAAGSAANHICRYIVWGEI